MTLRSQRAVLGCCLAALLGAAGGCHGLGPGGTIAERLQAEDPDVRIEAIHDAARQGGRDVLPLLVERLSDAHDEVRFFAFIALRRRTGKTFGYRYYDSREDRQQAIERWREYLRGNGLDPSDPNSVAGQEGGKT